MQLMRMRWRIAIALAAVLVAYIAIYDIVSPPSQRPTPTARVQALAAAVEPTATRLVPTNTLVPKPTATATPGPRPALGGSLNAFVQQLGTPNDHSGLDGGTGDAHFRRCLGSNVDQWIVVFLDGGATLITRQPCGRAQSVEDRTTEALRYMPSDAQELASFTTDQGESARTFLSPALGQGPISSERFHDCDGEFADRGTFSLVMEQDNWSLAVGTCP